jgi:xylanolytic transcriptional activator XlnR
MAPLEHNPNSNLINSSLPTTISNNQDLPLSQLEAMADDYQMFNLDFEDFGEVFEHRPLTTQDNNSGIRGRPRGPGSEFLGSMLGIQTMHSNNRRHVYGVHSFEAIGDADASSSELPPSLPSPTNLLNISRSGMLGQATSDAEQRKLHSIHRQERSLRNASGIRYPVLQDLMPFLRPLIPDALAYDLLEAYFRVNPVTNAQLTPCAPPLVFRRQSFLRHEQPRRSTRALLASMLWLSAQTADIPVLNASVARRKYVRRKLLELTTNLLKPLNEVSFGSGFPQSVGSSSQDRPSGEGEFSSHSDMADSVDEIMAYVHLAMVTSASEFKGASLRWWNVAFSLAHEAKLHQEITESLFDGMSDADDADSPHPLLSSSYPHESLQNFRLDDERKEERQRIWWFLYTMDRHLSFSYNKPLCLLDSECQNLNRPCDDTTWQSDQAYNQSEAHPLGKGPWFECTGPTFFGFFTPLMALLGEIVYFVQAQNHPRFGVSQSTLLDWKNWEKGIEDRLKLYQQGLETLLLAPTTRDDTEQGADFQARGSISNPTTSSPPTSAAPVRNRIAYAYSKIILHVLFILLMGKWDPHTLLNVSNDWLSSAAFGRAIGHAVDAASSAEMLLDLDPDAHFMPFFINIYLFHGSMPILLVADRVGHDAAAAIVHAADTMVRVQETGAIRMPAEYQVCPKPFMVLASAK